MKRIMTRTWFHAVAATLLLAAALPARAEGPGPLELAIGTGYTRGFGRAAGQMAPALQDLAGNGGSLRLEIGWRIDTTGSSARTSRPAGRRAAIGAPTA